MSTWVTVAELRVVLSDVPAGAAVDAALQVMLDAAEDTIGRVLIGVTIALPAPPALQQVVRELASAYWLTKGAGGRIATQGVDGSGAFEYFSGLTRDQLVTLRQIRVENMAIAI